MTVSYPMDKGWALTPFIQSSASLHALSDGRSALLACSADRERSATDAACFIMASLQADETAGSFVLEHPARKISPARAETAMGTIFILMPYEITATMENLKLLIVHGVGL